MAGFQIPLTKEGEVRNKRRIGRVTSETDLLDIFSLRLTGHFVERTAGGSGETTTLAFPADIQLYFAGTFSQTVSYFVEFEHVADELRGMPGGTYEPESTFGLGKEAFVMFDLGGATGVGHAEHAAVRPSEGTRPMLMGPMLMIGKIDPSTNFSYPTNRQFILDIPGEVENAGLERFGLAPYAFASKFFGVTTVDGRPVEVTRSVLYNAAGDIGADTHLMVGAAMLQAGVLQGLGAGSTEADDHLDPYVMARINLGGTRYVSGSVSGLANWSDASALVDGAPIAWRRYGVAANIKVALLDVYGAVIWDRLSDLPSPISTPFDRTAVGATMEADYLYSDRTLWSLRYDHLSAGGFVDQRADGRVVSLQGRRYVRDNFSLFVRTSVNLADVSPNPLRNFRSLLAFGMDIDI